MFVKQDSYDSFSESLDEAEKELPAVRAPIPDHILFLFTFLCLLALCLFSGSPHYTEYVWHSASEVFIAAVLFTLGGGRRHTNG